MANPNDEIVKQIDWAALLREEVHWRDQPPIAHVAPRRGFWRSFVDGLGLVPLWRWLARSLT